MKKEANKFRPTLTGRFHDSLEGSLATDDHSAVLEQPKFWARAITWSLIGVTAFGVGWLAIAKTEEIVTVTGKLEPIGDVKDIQMPTGGVVKKILVKDGERVTKGQPLLQLDTEATIDRQQSIRKTVSLKEQQLMLKQEEMQRYLDVNTTAQEGLKRAFLLEKEVLQRLETLNKEGATAELQYLSQLNKVQEVEGKLQEAQADRLRQQAIIEQAIRQIKSELADLRSNLIELNVNIRNQEIKAPEDGFVFDLKPKLPGFVAQTSEPVMKVLPFDKMVARVEIPSKDIGFVSVGRPVDISIDSFPASDFGVLNGLVSRIGTDALPPDEANPNYRFPADIYLNTQQLNLKDGTSLPLQVGMSLQANIKLRKVTYLQLLLGTFKDKSESLQRL